MDKSSTTFAITGTVATTEGYFNIFVSYSPFVHRPCPRFILSLSLYPALYSKMSSPMGCTLPTGSHLYSASWRHGEIRSCKDKEVCVLPIPKFSKMCFWQCFEFLHNYSFFFVLLVYKLQFHWCSNGISILLIPKLLNLLISLILLIFLIFP